MRGKNKWKSYKRIFNEPSPSPYSPVPHALGEGHTEHFKLLFPYLSVDTFYFTFLKQVYFQCRGCSFGWRTWISRSLWPKTQKLNTETTVTTSIKTWGEKAGLLTHTIIFTLLKYTV